jgi:DNA polymerase, archaea type
LTVSGWLFDAYPSKDKMVFWIKTLNGNCIRLEDNWTHSIYVAAGNNRQGLESLAANKVVQYYINDYDFVQRLERITDHEKSEVLKLTLADSRKAQTLGNVIEDIDYCDKFRLYNVDVLPTQAYFYEHDLFPLAKCKVYMKGNDRRLAWEIDDDEGLESTDYELPDFKIANLDITLKQEARLPQFSDKIDTITLTVGGKNNDCIEISKQSEEDALVELMEELAQLDPDFIFTVDGDEFLFPYLAERAAANNSPLQLIIGREKNTPFLKPPKEGSSGITYFSYGKVHYRPSTVMLYGRVHIDTRNSFILDHSALQGLYEIARICRIPLHTCARATIGRCLSSLQFYQAFKRELLIPWKPVNTERWKSYNELFRADRGGLIFEPVVGVHENVAEFDFASLYPSIMMKRNVSGETVNCDCCPDSKNMVEEMGYHICEKRRGIVSQALELPLSKRAKYKYLKKRVTTNDGGGSRGVRAKIYDSRQDALKWIGVVSFGYLGHANSKFGLIDSHIIVCAIDREVLVTARNLVEEMGFSNLHGIVDSLWVHKSGATRDDYAQLKEPIKKATGYDISFEGVYKWIVFLPSRQNNNKLSVPVPNRYFGVFEDGNVIKDRGIETRRHDAPAYFSKFQREILETMAQGNNIEEVRALMIPKVKETFQKYKQQLKEGRVPLTDLIFTKILSKDSSLYRVNTVETNAIYQLEDEGKSMRAGQILQYIITDYYRKNCSSSSSRRRSTPVELINKKTTYDARRYVELLAEVCNSITVPFGYSATGN